MSLDDLRDSQPSAESEPVVRRVDRASPETDKVTRAELRQLVASGLVESRAHRGAVVAQPSIDRLTGMFEAMAELEALCAGLAAERMPPADRQKLEAIHEE